ncbi:MAG: hypothetical protein KDD36_12285 [Flavobacteriales bacterium]|nr:hypothetical protein [Flavobacteriales bacterium]
MMVLLRHMAKGVLPTLFLAFLMLGGIHPLMGHHENHAKESGAFIDQLHHHCPACQFEKQSGESSLSDVPDNKVFDTDIHKPTRVSRPFYQALAAYFLRGPPVSLNA